MASERLWRWRGIDEQGIARTGALWAADRTQALQALLQDRRVPLTLRRCTIQRSLWHPRHSCEIIHQLAVLLQAGLPLSEGLELLAQQQTNAQWQALLQTLARQLAQGIPLSNALEKWPQVFPPLWLAMVRTGELTGKLDICCLQLARQQRQELVLTEKIKKALRYPAMILALAVLMVIAMIFFVLPEFTAIYQTFNTPLPLLTRIVSGAGEALTRRWPTLLLLAGMPFALIRLTRQHPRWWLRRQRLLYALPAFGPLLNGQRLSHIFTILALTQNAGIGFLQGLESVEKTLNCPLWLWRIRHARSRIAQGETICQALSSCGGFTPLCLQLIRTGEATGSLDNMLQNLACHHSEQTHQQADNLATLLEPLLLIVTGIITGTLVVAMYLPIFHLGDAISGAAG